MVVDIGMTQLAVWASRYTGKERDTESGLDYFGARYYGSNMGRWMSPDWADKPEPVPYSSLVEPNREEFGIMHFNCYVHGRPSQLRVYFGRRLPSSSKVAF
jgi:RHS repeat-associated protein